MECAVYALEGVGWNGMPVEGVGWVAGGGLLMGKGTMVCGDTLMFNHKWPPTLVLTSLIHYSSPWLSRVHCTLSSTEHLCKPPASLTLRLKVTLLSRGRLYAGCVEMIQWRGAGNKNPNPHHGPGREGHALWLTGHQEQRGPNRVHGGQGSWRARPRQHRFCHNKHLKDSLMNQTIDTSDVGCSDLTFQRSILHPTPTSVHATGVTPGLGRCWKEWDQSSNISQALWISMFKAMVCLCLLSGSWAGLQYSQRLEIRLWWSSPTGLALACLPVRTLRLKRWYHSWVGVDAWEAMTNTVRGGQFQQLD